MSPATPSRLDPFTEERAIYLHFAHRMPIDQIGAVLRAPYRALDAAIQRECRRIAELEEEGDEAES